MTSAACRPGWGTRVVWTASEMLTCRSACARGASIRRDTLKTFADVFPRALTKCTATSTSRSCDARDALRSVKRMTTRWREIEVLEPAIAHEEQVRPIEKWRHAGAGEPVGGMLRSERTEHVDGVGIRLRQVDRERPRDVAPAIEKLERIKARAGASLTNRLTGKPGCSRARSAVRRRTRDGEKNDFRLSTQACFEGSPPE